MAAATLTVDLNARIAQFETELKRASGTLDGFSKRGNAALATLKSGLAGLAGAVSAGALAALVKGSIDAADGLNDMSLRLGVSVKDLASFKLAAEQSGSSLEGVGIGIARLTRSIGEAERGNKAAAQALDELGITARDPREAFLQLADAVQRTEDPSKRAALLSQVLGKNYQELVPLLSQGGAELRKSAAASESFADAMARLAPNADRFNDELTRMKQAAAGAGAQIASVAVGPMAEWLESVNKLIDRHGVLIGVLSGVGAAALPGITAGGLAGSVGIDAFKRELESARKELQTIEAATKSGTFGLIQLALYGSEQEMRRKGEFLRSNVKTLEESIRQFNQRIASKPASLPDVDNSAQLKCIANDGIWDGKKCVVKPSRVARSTTDPLASLLGSTQIGKLKEFDKTVALLNARFDGGRKNTELYTQAMTALVETTFANRFRAAAEDAEFLRMVEQDGIETTNEWNQRLRELANVDMGRLNEMLQNTDFARLKKDQADMVLLADAFSVGIKDADGNLRKLSESEYLDAVRNRLGLVAAEAAKAGSAFEQFAKRAAENIHDAIADFLFDPFSDGLEGLEKKFGQTVQRMIADAVAADLAQKLFGDLVQGGAGSGWIADILSGFSLPGSDQNILGSIASVFGFAKGGVMTPHGPLPLQAYAGGGIANRPQLALFGEGSMPEAFVPVPSGKIPVELRGGGAAPITVNVTVNMSGGSAGEARRAGAEVARRIVGELQRAQRYG